MFKDEQKQFNNHYIFAVVYVIERFLTKEEGTTFLTELEALVEEYEDYIQFEHIGFPNNWKDLLTNIINKEW